MGRIAAIALVSAILAVVVGCNDGGGMSRREMDSVKSSPAPTAADRDRVMHGMKEGAEAARRQQRDWAAKNAQEVARINAERAKMGRPPLGN